MSRYRLLPTPAQEAALRGHPDVADALALVREDAPGEPRLVAYAVPRDGSILDADADRVAQFVARQPIEITGYGPDDFDRMITEARVDRVIVASPDHSHAGYVLAALDRGRDVIVEKPMTSTAADAARVLAAERAGTAPRRVVAGADCDHVDLPGRGLVGWPVPAGDDCGHVSGGGERDTVRSALGAG